MSIRIVKRKFNYVVEYECSKKLEQLSCENDWFNVILFNIGLNYVLVK